MGGTPPPKLVLWNDAAWEYVPQLQDTGKGIIVIVKRPNVAVSPPYLLSLLLPVIVGIYLFWRYKYESKKSKRSK